MKVMKKLDKEIERLKKELKKRDVEFLELKGFEGSNGAFIAKAFVRFNNIRNLHAQIKGLRYAKRLLKRK